jgi:hypothetical protein
MQEISLPPPDAGFVVDWQITDDNPLVDLSTVDTEVILIDAATVRAGLGREAEN